MSELITLSLPCPSCGCDTVVGHCKKDGVPIKVEICACMDGSGYFDMHVAYNYDNPEKKTEDYLKYKSKEDIEAFVRKKW